MKTGSDKQKLIRGGGGGGGEVDGWDEINGLFIGTCIWK